MIMRIYSTVITLVVFGMCRIDAQTVTDGDGNTYNTIKIGGHIWMIEDLHTTKCNTGTAITLVFDATIWGALTTPGYSWYDATNTHTMVAQNNAKIAQIAAGYGALYNWYAVTSCNICPDGWRVPSDAEWTALIDFLDPATVDPNAFSQSFVAGSALKEIGNSHWLLPNTDATNSSGFSGLPGGARLFNGTFLNFGNNGFWWSSTEKNTSNAWYRSLETFTGNVTRDDGNKKDGFPVRCLRDFEQIPTLSEWKLMICGLMLLILGVLGVRKMYWKQQSGKSEV